MHAILLLQNRQPGCEGQGGCRCTHSPDLCSCFAAPRERSERHTRAGLWLLLTTPWPLTLRLGVGYGLSWMRSLRTLVIDAHAKAELQTSAGSGGLGSPSLLGNLQQSRAGMRLPPAPFLSICSLISSQRSSTEGLQLARAHQQMCLAWLSRVLENFYLVANIKNLGECDSWLLLEDQKFRQH